MKRGEEFNVESFRLYITSLFSCKTRVHHVCDVNQEIIYEQKLKKIKLSVDWTFIVYIEKTGEGSGGEDTTPKWKLTVVPYTAMTIIC